MPSHLSLIHTATDRVAAAQDRDIYGRNADRYDDLMDPVARGLRLGTVAARRVA